ncbi:hypothetical protein EDC94DRAFT_632107, partial [Helicostylum pulchrum]
MSRNTIPNVQASSSRNRFRTSNHDGSRQAVTVDYVTREEHNKVVREVETIITLFSENDNVRRKKQKKQPFLCKIVSTAFKTYSSGFDFDVPGMLTGTNNDVFKLIEGCVYGTEYFQTNMCLDGVPMSDKVREFKSLCRTSYDSLKKRKALERDPYLLAQRRAHSNKCSRMSRKFKSRIRTFSGEEEQTKILGIMNLPLDECKAFLIKECMSEEEDDEFYPNSNIASSLKVIVPTWRSEKLNLLFETIDKVRFESSSHLQETKRRVTVSASLNVPLSVVNKRLPAVLRFLFFYFSWYINNNIDVF